MRDKGVWVLAGMGDGGWWCSTMRSWIGRWIFLYEARNGAVVASRSVFIEPMTACRSKFIAVTCFPRCYEWMVHL